MMPSALSSSLLWLKKKKIGVNVCIRWPFSPRRGVERIILDVTLQKLFELFQRIVLKCTSQRRSKLWWHCWVACHKIHCGLNCWRCVALLKQCELFFVRQSVDDSRYILHIFWFFAFRNRVHIQIFTEEVFQGCWQSGGVLWAAVQDLPPTDPGQFTHQKLLTQDAFMLYQVSQLHLQICSQFTCWKLCTCCTKFHCVPPNKSTCS